MIEGKGLPGVQQAFPAQVTVGEEGAVELLREDGVIERLPDGVPVQIEARSVIIH